MPSDDFWMSQALQEALKGRHRTYPNPWVGALLVKAGRLVGRGHHQRAGEPHAEALALRRAGARAKGATLYATLEPCNHSGKTPPCTLAILRAGVARVVAACPDPGSREGGGLAFLASQGVKTGPWALRAEAEQLLAPFLFSVRQGRPWVLLKAGMTLDGKLATASGESKWVTGPEAREDARRLRGECDGLLVGAGTVAADDPGLKPAPGSPFFPQRFILDPKAALGMGPKVFSQRAKPWWLVGPGATASQLRAAERKGVKVQRFSERGLDGMMLQVMGFLGSLKLRRLMVEGGSQVLGACLRLGLAEELALYIAPKLLGGQDSLAAFGGPGPESLAQARKVELSPAEPMGGGFKVSGRFIKG
jgi:diaminohydroxyphosphoribosylaminopyrimidine deaminase/5-amino-6-(5-phosphoribosylamino)uracil reductase